MLIIAVILLLAIGLAHSWLGERYILVRLFRRPLPKLFGDDRFTKRTLRFAWHITTVAWFGFAALLATIHLGDSSRPSLLTAIGSTFALTACVALIASRGKHLSWIVFGVIAALCFLSA